MPSTLKTVIFWLVIVVSAALLWQTVKSGSTAHVPEISYSSFLARVASGEVRSVTITGREVNGVDTHGVSFRVIAPENQTAMLDTLQQHGVDIWFKDTTAQTWPSWILNLAPLVLLGALWFFMVRQMQVGQMQRARRVADTPPGFTPPQESKPRFGS